MEPWLSLSAFKELMYRLRTFTAQRFLTRLRRATHRMPIKLRPVEHARVLVISPHYDDETIGCGGTLLLHRNAGSVVRVVFATNCEDGISSPYIARAVSKVRLTEASRVACLMGFESIKPYTFRNAIGHENQLSKKLAQEVEAFKPTQVFCPFPIDAHADHQSCALAVARALKKTRWQGDVYCYEVWSTLWPNAAVDVTDVIKEKEDLICMYASQMEDRDYATAIIALNRYRGLQHRLDYAEAFHVCSPQGLYAMTDLLNTL